MQSAYQFEELPVLHGLSEEDFFRLCQENPQLRLERTANQDIVIMPPTGSEASEWCNEVGYQLTHWNRPTMPGRVYDSSGTFTFPDSSVRSPDAAWLSRAVWETLTPEQRRKFPSASPEFVVEVKSPSDRLKDLQTKMEAYLANGVQLGFLLDVDAEMAYIYRSGQPTETVTGYEQELSGEPVLPGFRLDLRPLRLLRS